MNNRFRKSFYEGTVHSTMKTCDEDKIEDNLLYESVEVFANRPFSGHLFFHQ